MSSLFDGCCGDDWYYRDRIKSDSEHSEALSGFGNRVIWLIVTAFFISRGFMKTGLGARIAYLSIAWLGKKSLGPAYGFVATDLVLSPAIPVILPVVVAFIPDFAIDSRNIWQ
ncbi:MAG: hypothetical protein CM1200mP3_10120 [Chloroflexota bacterium]|nr:MAG: hypothetical protein CM1200mP3_10120 [Chloroflexota bacterium]